MPQPLALSPVRRLRQFHHIHVGNAINECGWHWRNPKRRPTNIEKMINGLPRPVILRVLAICEARYKKG